MTWCQYDDFEIWWAQNLDFAITCSARPQTCVLNTFHRSRTVFTIWRWFEASTTILRSGVLKIGILETLAPHGSKRAFWALFIEVVQFPRFGDDLRPPRRFWGLVCSKVTFCQNCYPRPQTYVLCTFHRNSTVFTIGRWFEASTTITTTLRSCVLKSEILPKLAPHGPERAFCALFIEIAQCSRFCDYLRSSTTSFRSGVLKNKIWPKHAPHRPKRAFCAIFIEFSEFGVDLRRKRRFWGLVYSKVRFCQNLLRTAAKDVSWAFHRNRTVFTIRRWFEASTTILRSDVLKSEIFPKLSPHGPKGMFMHFS